jgi:hypothetical protein
MADKFNEGGIKQLQWDADFSELLDGGMVWKGN